MTALIQARDLGYSLGGKLLFENLNFTVNQGERIGLVGHNGAGKTSLLKLLAADTQPDLGGISRRRGLRVATVEQFVPQALLDESLRSCVLELLPVNERLDYRADAVLQALGFEDAQLSAPLRRLSGGQQNLALLARAQVLEPDVLLMDEPGNHMDVSALTALRRYLQEMRNMTYVLISHDRDLLDDCCTHTVFLRDRTTYTFSLPYTEARRALEQADEQAAHRQQAEEKEISRIRKSAKRLAVWGKTYDNEDLARKAKSMARRADKLEAEKTFVSRGSGLELSLNSSTMRSKQVVALEDFVVRALDDERVLARCDYLVVRPGDRIALLGANGAGKSTTIKRMLSDDAGEAVRLNPNVKIGYVDQGLDAFQTDLSRQAWLAERTQAGEGEIKKVLLQAGVAYRDFSQRVTTLSGGEKARMMFMALRLEQPNFMILDEPTNHIDLESREELETELQASGATLLITSHDRRFLQTVCDRFWVIEGGRLEEVDTLDQYYAKVGWSQGAHADSKPSRSDTLITDEESVLGRIEELEGLLQSDLQRKKKFQKPQKQAEWRAELERLWSHPSLK